MRRHERIKIFLVVAGLTLLGVWPAAAYFPQSHGQEDQQHQAHRAGVEKRGDEAMGFPHTGTTHHFLLRKDGGIIEVEVNDSSDRLHRDEIRKHLHQVAREFALGDFSKPGFIHGRIPPGVPTLQRLRGQIDYRAEDTPRGARVLIRTDNPEARAALHAFLRFQINDHHTGDSLRVRESP